MLSEAKFELPLQETRAERAVDSIKLNSQLRLQDTEFCRRGQEYEVARQENDLLRSELQSRESTSRSSSLRLTGSGRMKEGATVSNKDPFSEFRESQFTVNELTAQIQELQHKVSSVNDSGEFHDVESACSSKLSHVPSQPVIVPSPCGVLSRDHCQQSNTVDFLGASGNVFENSSAPVGSTAPISGGLLHGRHPVITFDGSVFFKYRETCCQK